MLVLSSGSLQRYGLHRVFRFAREAGYDGVDIEISQSCDTQDALYIQELIKETGIPVISLLLPKKFKKKDELLEYVDLAKNIGAKIIAVNPPKLFDFEYTQWLKESLVPLRKKEQLHIALMNVIPNRMFGFLPEHALNSLNDLKRFQEVCIDTSNVYFLKEDLIEVYSKLKKEIIHIFLSNVHHGKDHRLPMEGVLPLESLLTKLKKDGYQGALSIRVRGTDLSEGKPEKVVQHLKDIKTFVEKYYRE